MMTERLKEIIFILCLIICKIYVKRTSLFYLIYKYKKYHLHGLSLVVSKLGGGGARGVFFFLGGGAGLLIKVKKSYIGGPLSIFFLEKGADPANDSLKNE